MYKKNVFINFKNKKKKPVEKWRIFERMDIILHYSLNSSKIALQLLKWTGSWLNFV